jgi:hypothetical protein
MSSSDGLGMSGAIPLLSLCDHDVDRDSFTFFYHSTYCIAFLCRYCYQPRHPITLLSLFNKGGYRSVFRVYNIMSSIPN